MKYRHSIRRRRGCAPGETISAQSVRPIEYFEKLLLRERSSGQLQKDIERLKGDIIIYIDQVPYPLWLDPDVGLKFFGVITKGVRVSDLEAKVRKARFYFEATAVPVHQNDLKKWAEELVPLARDLVTNST
ncbi:uncharacterized protein F5Z01DRAFT_376080 [Emericellopsis atlantica]|uniref:Uncharacterized protein n=1 Tax=Emericellopsis atlantica TaxID=2614577 RepID=A0A9P8CKR4_9HYPO|nr:uncharacterized protein F5Z01DRAFT_376080 [Emericellopsis atlantica]KAG9250317.1 hypothetical protein F5Z01DRAFT_376080 [Emericellopsis atlantica]